MKYKFEVEFLEPAIGFLETLEEKSREKILYNIWKSGSVNDNELFKKLSGEILEFRTLYKKQHLRLFAFWDKSNSVNTIVIATHGIIKKTGKTPKEEIGRAEDLRVKFFNEKER